MSSETIQSEEMDVERAVLLQKKKGAVRVARQEETPNQQQLRLEQQRSRSRSRIASETDEQRVARLEKQRERSRSKINSETGEERRMRQLKNAERVRLNRATEMKEQREGRLISSRTRTQAVRANESTDQNQKRKKKDNERKKAVRQNETADQNKKRLQRQKSLSQANRAKTKIDKRSSSGIYAYLRSISTQSDGSNRFVTCGNDTDDNADKNTDSTLPSWPEPIPVSLKNNLLQQFVEQMSMSALAETVCAVCHVRASVKKTKKIPVSEISGLDLLVLSQDLKDLIITSHSSTSKNFSALSGRDVNLINTGQTSSGKTTYIKGTHADVSLFS